MDELARLMARHDPAPHEVPPDELLLAEILATARPRRCSTLSWRLTFGAALATGLVILAAGAIPTARAPDRLTVAAYFRHPGAPLALCGEPGPRPRRLPGTGGGGRRVVLGLAEAATRSGRAATRGHGRITAASSLLRPDGRSGVLSRQWTPGPGPASAPGPGRSLGPAPNPGPGRSLRPAPNPGSGHGLGRRVEYPLEAAGDRLVQGTAGREGAYRRGLTGDGPVGAIIAANESEVLDGPRTAALWRALAGRPGLRALGRIVDRRERGGQGVAFDMGRTERWVLVADAGTGDLLGVERVMLRAADGLEATPPCVRDFWTFLDRADVTTVGD
ncbi:hypothetical protein ACIBEJ_11590 [Nonomuraea sp. NPDC050790]|uniref:hypothetical protein n=1 Tax=Nonomuraea sp. NPDC050790 TaxID=3364371 RepID=UPI0037B9D14B